MQPGAPPRIDRDQRRRPTTLATDGQRAPTGFAIGTFVATDPTGSAANSTAACPLANSCDDHRRDDPGERAVIVPRTVTSTVRRIVMIDDPATVNFPFNQTVQPPALYDRPATVAAASMTTVINTVRPLPLASRAVTIGGCWADRPHTDRQTVWAAAYAEPCGRPSLCGPNVLGRPGTCPWAKTSEAPGGDDRAERVVIGQSSP